MPRWHCGSLCLGVARGSNREVSEGGRSSGIPRIPGVRVPRSPSLHPGFLRPLQAPSFRVALLPPRAHSAPHLEFTDLRRPQSRTPVSRHRPRAGRCHLRPPTSRAGGGACGTNEPALWLCSRLRKKVRKRRQMPLWVGL